MKISTMTKQSSSATCLKICIYSVNMFYWIMSILLVGMGLHVYVDKTSSVLTYVDVKLEPALAMIFFACLLFFSTTVACIATLRENKLMLKINVAMTSTALVGFMIIGITALAFAYSGGQSKLISIKQDFSAALKNYETNPFERKFLDKAQLKLRCCGVASYMDWQMNKYFECSSTNPSSKRCSVPASCCKHASSRKAWYPMCGYEMLKKPHALAENEIFIKGCKAVLEDMLRHNLIIVGFACFGVTIPVFVSICLAVMLSSTIRNERRLFEHSRTVFS